MIHQLKMSQIERETCACPYCGSERDRYDNPGCCGESSAHFETAYIVDGELLLESEVSIIDKEESQDEIA